MLHIVPVRSYRIAWWVGLLSATAFTTARSQDTEPAVPPAPLEESGIVYEVPSSPEVVAEITYQSHDAQVEAFIRANSIKYDPNTASPVLSGRGLAVAVIDSGVNPHHLAFSGEKLLPGRNFTDVGAPDDTTDTYGHGSHIAGIIAGRDPRDLPPDEINNYALDAGIAHEAMIIPLKIYNDGILDHPTPARLNAALEWLLTNRGEYQRNYRVIVGVVVISLGNFNFQSPEQVGTLNISVQLKAELLRHRELIRALRDAGVAVVTSSGNEYGRFNSRQGMAYPAICPETISVGAVYDMDYDYNHDTRRPSWPGGVVPIIARAGRCMPFSQRLGEIQGQEYRTDVFAPGSQIESAGPFVEGNELASRTGTTKNDGTSFAAPVTAGVILLFQEDFLRKTRRDDPPPVDLIENSLRVDGYDECKFIDDEEAPPKYDNVTNSGETFYVLRAPRAYERFDQLVPGWITASAYQQGGGGAWGGNVMNQVLEALGQR